jgi:hypothetical protein
MQSHGLGPVSTRYEGSCEATPAPPFNLGRAYQFNGESCSVRSSNTLGPKWPMPKPPTQINALYWLCNLWPSRSTFLDIKCRHTPVSFACASILSEISTPSITVYPAFASSCPTKPVPQSTSMIGRSTLVNSYAKCWTAILYAQ